MDRDDDGKESCTECLAYLLTGILPVVLVRNASFIQLENKSNTVLECPTSTLRTMKKSFFIQNIYSKAKIILR